MAPRKQPPLTKSSTVPVERGFFTVARSVFRGKARITVSKLEFDADVVQLGEMIDALVARRHALIQSDTTGDIAGVD